MSYEKTRSNWWFFIAYFVLRGDDPRKAKNCLYLGLALFGIGIVIQLAVFGTVLPSIEEGFKINV